jgi:hypothetical protein
LKKEISINRKIHQKIDKRAIQKTSDKRNKHQNEKIYQKREKRTKPKNG